MNNSENTFDFSSIPAERPASWNQLKYRIGNIAVAYLFSLLGLKSGAYESTNGRFFNQMGSALKTATLNNPLNNGDVRAIDKGLTKTHKSILKIQSSN